MTTCPNPEDAQVLGGEDVHGHPLKLKFHIYVLLAFYAPESLLHICYPPPRFWEIDFLEQNKMMLAYTSVAAQKNAILPIPETI